MPVRFVTAPPRVRTCDLGPVTVLLDALTGDVETLLGPACEVWATLAACGDVARAARQVPDLEPARVYELVDGLVAARLLTVTLKPRPWPSLTCTAPTEQSWGTQELPAQLVPPGAASWRDIALAGLTLALTVAVRQLGRADTRFARLLRLVEWAASHSWRRASPEEAERAINAVRRVACLLPARVACLEETIAVALVLAATGRRVTWCHGVAADPIRFHAWVETEDGRRVGEPAETDRYTPLIEIPAPKRPMWSTRRL